MSQKQLSIKSLIPSTKYAVQIRALNDTDASEWSRKFTFTTTDDDVAPKVPTGFTWIAGDGYFQAQWNEVTKNVDESNARVTRYILRLEVGSAYKLISIPATGDNPMEYRVTQQRIEAFFGKGVDTVSARVKAINKGEIQGAYTALLSASISDPDAPTNAVVEGTTDGLKISWTAPANMSNVDGYNVYISTSGAGFTPTLANRIYHGEATTCTYNTATYALHHIKIRSFSRFGKESPDLVASGTPVSPFIVDITPPDVPAIVNGSSSLTNNPNGIGANATLVWTQSVPDPDDLAAFDIRYRKVGDTVYSSGGRVDKADRSALIPVPLASTNYEFQIRSVDYDTNVSAWSATVTLTGQANVAPANIATLFASAGDNSITYSWTPVSDSDLKTYEVTFSTSSTFASGNTTFYTGTAATLTVGGLSYATTYYARVRAVDNGGLTSSTWSATNTTSTNGMVTTDGVVPAVPTAPVVTSGPAGSLYVTWAPVTTNQNGTASTDIVTYEVHLSTTSGFTPTSGTKVSEITGSTSTIIDTLPGTTTALTYGTTYYIKLVAKDGDGTQATASGQGSGAPTKVASGDVQSIGADLIIPGTGFASALQISSGGSIQSTNYNPATPAGWKISSAGAEFLGSDTTVSAATIKAGTLGGTSGSGVINIGVGTSLIFNGGYLKSNTYTGTSQATNPSNAGFYLGNDGIRIDQGIISASALVTGTISGTNTISLSGANARIETLGYNGTSGFRLSGTGLDIPAGSLNASVLNITSTFANSTVAATTYIDGGKITTGTIQSSQYTSIGGTSQPLWSIALNGAATFADASVRGKLVVGPAGSTDSSYVQSGNYNPGSWGWKIEASGNAYFNQATINGSVTASYFKVAATAGTGDRIEVASGGDLTFLTNAGQKGKISPGISGLVFLGPTSATGWMTFTGNALDLNCDLILEAGGNNIELSGGTIYNVSTLTNVSSITGGPTISGNPQWTNSDAATGTANVNWNAGRLRQAASSAAKYKHSIRPLTEKLAVKDVIALEPVTFHYNEGYAMNPNRDYFGFIADHAANGPLDIFVEYADGEVENFDYAKFSAAQQLALRDHDSRIETLENEVAELRSLVGELLNRLN